MTDMPKWTPGPWSTDAKGGFPFDVHQKSTRDMVCRVEEVDGAESDAALIAQSPTMIDALVQWQAAEAMGDEEEMRNARNERDRIIKELMEAQS